jgi:hypothetical protein
MRLPIPPFPRRVVVAVSKAAAKVRLFLKFASMQEKKRCFLLGMAEPVLHSKKTLKDKLGLLP